MEKSITLDPSWLYNSIIPSFLLRSNPVNIKAHNSGNANKEEALFSVSPDQFPLLPGHLNIFPNKKLISLFELSRQEWLELFTFLKSLNSSIQSNNPFNIRQCYREFLKEPANATSELMLRKALESGTIKPFVTDSFTLAINEGPDSGRLHDSLQMHFIPRNRDDIKDPRGGVRRMFIQPNTPGREIQN